MSDEPVPELATLSLTLTRDQGLLHSSGTGAGSDMDSLSHVAHSQHAAISPIVLSYSSSFRAAQAAMNPANLPKAPSELPRLLVVGEQDPSSASGTTASSTAVTPDHSRPGTPGSSTPSTPVNGAGAALPLVTGDKSPSAVAVPMSVSSSASSIVTNKTVPARPVVTERKSVFGKLFERNNGSTTSVASTGTSGTTTPAETGTGTAAPLTRKVSKKEKDKEDKEQKEGRPRAASNGNGYLSSSSANEKGGMGAALNEFMRNKVARKSSATSKKSDDGKSDRGSQAGGEGSQYGGSTKEESKSKSGQTTTSTLKKYGVCEKVLIGKGATAVVKLAHKWDRSIERLYAVKVSTLTGTIELTHVGVPQASQERNREGVRQEAHVRVLHQLDAASVRTLPSSDRADASRRSQNIVETVDLVQDEQSHWCEVMEYCPGGDLYAAIKKGNMGSPQINSYFKQILCGVSYLHSMGVAHRDIKPENLLLDAKGHVKITDFGVSDVFRMCWEKTTHLSKGLCGSEPYIAPEQFEQKGTFSPRSF